MNKIETWAPVFPGFYGTIWEMDDESEIYNLNEDVPEGGKEITYDDLDIDNTKYMYDVCKEFTNVLSDILSERIQPIEKIEMQKVVSPRWYNFSNDGIDIAVHVTSISDMQQWILGYIKKHKQEWDTYLHEHYTSCPGFISSFPNNAEGWRAETENYTKLDSHYLGAILQFYCQVEQIEEQELYYQTMESIYVGEYVSVKETENA